MLGTTSENQEFDYFQPDYNEEEPLPSLVEDVDKITSWNRPYLTRNKVLAKHGYDLDTCGNHMFKECSKEWHILQRLSEMREEEKFKNMIQHINNQKGSIQGAGSCIPLLTLDINIPTFIAIEYCEKCRHEGMIWSSISQARMIAMLVAPKDDAWMCVLRSNQTAQKGLIFQTSHRCNV